MNHMDKDRHEHITCVRELSKEGIKSNQRGGGRGGYRLEGSSLGWRRNTHTHTENNSYVIPSSGERTFAFDKSQSGG